MYKKYIRTNLILVIKKKRVEICTYSKDIFRNYIESLFF